MIPDACVPFKIVCLDSLPSNQYVLQSVHESTSSTISAGQTTANKAQHDDDESLQVVVPVNTLSGEQTFVRLLLTPTSAPPRNYRHKALHHYW